MTPFHCTCDYDNLCPGHAAIDELESDLARIHRRMLDDALNIARILIAAAPFSADEIDATLALQDYAGLPHRLVADEKDVADWAFRRAQREADEWRLAEEWRARASA